MSSLTSDLYGKPQSGVSTLTRRGFLFAISTFTMCNIGVAGLTSSWTYSWKFEQKSWWYLLFILACFAVAVVGIYVAESTNDAMTTIVGGFITAGAMGAMIGPFLARFQPSDVLQAFVVTAGIVLLTGLVGAVMPKDLSMWGAPLFAGLLGLILLYLLTPILVWLGADFTFTLHFLDVVGILLFSALMVYDLNKAVRLDLTLRNAAGVAMSVFLNFLNIFIRVLSLSGSSND